MRDSTVLVVLLLATLGTVTDGKWDSATIKAALKDRGSQHLYLLTVALNVAVTEVTCSSVTISWTSEDNRTADFLILYNSTVHDGVVNYTSDASPPYTTKLTNLVADTEYTITVIAKHSDNIPTSDTAVTANTLSGTASKKGILEKKAIVHCIYCKYRMDYRTIEHNLCLLCSHTCALYMKTYYINAITSTAAIMSSFV